MVLRAGGKRKGGNCKEKRERRKPKGKDNQAQKGGEQGKKKKKESHQKTDLSNLVPENQSDRPGIQVKVKLHRTASQAYMEGK